MRAERVAHKIARRRVGTLELRRDSEGVPVCSLVTIYDIRDFVNSEGHSRDFVAFNYNILSGSTKVLNRNEVSNTDCYKVAGTGFI